MSLPIRTIPPVNPAADLVVAKRLCVEVEFPHDSAVVLDLDVSGAAKAFNALGCQ